MSQIRPAADIVHCKHVTFSLTYSLFKTEKNEKLVTEESALQCIIAGCVVD